MCVREIDGDRVCVWEVRGVTAGDSGMSVVLCTVCACVLSASDALCVCVCLSTVACQTVCMVQC